MMAMHEKMVLVIAQLKEGDAKERSLREIDRPENAEAYVKDMLSRKKRVPGFGHAVYKVMDPR